MTLPASRPRSRYVCACASAQIRSCDARLCEPLTLHLVRTESAERLQAMIDDRGTLRRAIVQAMGEYLRAFGADHPSASLSAAHTEGIAPHSAAPASAEAAGGERGAATTDDDKEGGATAAAAKEGEAADEPAAARSARWLYAAPCIADVPRMRGDQTEVVRKKTRRGGVAHRMREEAKAFRAARDAQLAAATAAQPQPQPAHPAASAGAAPGAGAPGAPGADASAPTAAAPDAEGSGGIDDAGDSPACEDAPPQTPEETYGAIEAIWVAGAAHRAGHGAPPASAAASAAASVAASAAPAAPASAPATSVAAAIEAAKDWTTPTRLADGASGLLEGAAATATADSGSGAGGGLAQAGGKDAEAEATTAALGLSRLALHDAKLMEGEPKTMKPRPHSRTDTEPSSCSDSSPASSARATPLNVMRKDTPATSLSSRSSEGPASDGRGSRMSMASSVADSVADSVASEEEGGHNPLLSA